LPSGTPALDPADQLVHLALHGVLGGATRLAWLVDVSLAAQVVPDWAMVVQRCESAGATRAMQLILLRAQQWLPRTPVPRLGPERGWGVACRAVDRVSPLGEFPDRPSAGRSFARSVSSTTGASLREFAAHGAGWLLGGAKRSRDITKLTDAADIRSPLHRVEAPVDQARYFAELATIS
jgi:hypothetical protein